MFIFLPPFICDNRAKIEGMRKKIPDIRPYYQDRFSVAQVTEKKQLALREKLW